MQTIDQRGFGLTIPVVLSRRARWFPQSIGWRGSGVALCPNGVFRPANHAPVAAELRKTAVA